MKNQAIRLMALFFLGMVAGGVLVTVTLGGQVDEITHNNQLLSQQLELCRDELNQLKKSLGEKEKKVVTGIEPHIAILGENMARLEEKNTILVLEKQVRQWLEPVKGQEVDKLNYSLVPQIIDNRAVEFEGANYQLKVQLVVIDTNIIIYVEAKKEKLTRPVNQPSEPDAEF
ncbi:hypothetical protein Psfp_02258 [Pelotomaculum sp. FP]|uniref:hypothetical protein n=1 Tax=Pelotomaculum sp. FP TaxID=261474 RepID=UPI0010653997|nr:hypothetical protein [Pelotomaculum sp. FP]TEB15341.1 hypothetical protein Psfp_02258 [Pelotomaculum sp. FP]